MEPAARPTLKVSRLVVMMGSEVLRPLISSAGTVGSGKPPFSTRPAREGMAVEACAAARAMMIPTRSEGTTTSWPSRRRSIAWETSIAQMSRSSASRSSSAGSPESSWPSIVRITSPTLGAASSGTSGMEVTVSPSSLDLSRYSIASRSLGLQRLATTATTRACSAAISLIDTWALASASEGPWLPFTTSRVGAPMLAATWAFRVSSGLPATPS